MQGYFGKMQGSTSREPDKKHHFSTRSEVSPYSKSRESIVGQQGCAGER
jgi:hypothetical protein